MRKIKIFSVSEQLDSRDAEGNYLTAGKIDELYYEKLEEEVNRWAQEEKAEIISASMFGIGVCMIVYES